VKKKKLIHFFISGIRFNEIKKKKYFKKSITEIIKILFMLVNFFYYFYFFFSESLKLSDIIKLDKNKLSNYNLNNNQKEIIYENIKINDLKNSIINISLLEFSTKMILGQVTSFFFLSLPLTLIKYYLSQKLIYQK
jgi:hypothetical protein